ncbi:MAG: 4-hydroxy-3-methylbut-2-enyl diphosphate reductase [Epulopiscium sp. Nele67-Bin001]|nr:MAG: 4-hydroxy-3-methylbut-2-enyl diphosphate reductase [Epulopiscium sp. Nele67-Bin001]
MVIKIAESAGFCFGVERAVDLAYKREGQRNTYTLGPIIHNEIVINDLASKGISPIETISDDIEHLIIRSHGVTPTIYKQAQDNNINIIDATCPYVKKIHRLVAKHYSEGDSIIIIGDEKHPEIIGINGWGNNECIIVQDVNDAKLLTMNLNKSYFIVAQTTYKQEVVDKILDVLRKNLYKFKYVSTICDATSKRQQEAREIASQVDLMIVIGSNLSSNTQKLYEVCKQVCDNAFCIQNVNELDNIQITNKQKIGVTAGASTPASIIKEIVEKIESSLIEKVV